MKKPARTQQPNGIDELLDPENRVTAEAYYTARGVGSSAEERYAHFKDDQRLSREAYYQMNYDRTTEGDVRRLALLEWQVFQNRSGSE